MFEDLLQRDDVLNFINEIKTNERYFDKNIDDLLNPSFYMSREIALYIFYDALFKYKIVLDDVYLFDEYLEQLEKLYRKIDNFNDIRFGINKLIGRMLSIKLDIKNINDDQSKKLLIETIYHKYIKNGYFFHGINSNYAKSILENGFTPEDYDNLYESFEQLNRIFAKYNIIRIIYKDFTSKQAYFTDDIVMGCYYSIYSPLFFYKFLTNEEYFGKLVQKDSYLMGDYSVLIKRLKRFMSNNLFHEDDRKSVLDIVQKQMNLLHSENKKICFLLVRRDEITDNPSLDEFLSDGDDIYDIIDRLLSSKYNNISTNKVFSPSQFEIAFLDCYYENKKKELLKIDEEDEYYKGKEEEVVNDFLNVYGKVSIFLLLGALLIIIGVIVSIFLIFRGR